MNNIVIGIEGLVGAGKTTICKQLLNEIPNSILLHGGNLYRAIVYAVMNANKENIKIENLKENLKNINIKELMEKLKVDLKIENRETVFYINGKKVDEEELQSEKASLAVSLASNTADNSHLFIFGRQLIDTLKQKNNLIVSGRALMEIYPNLDYHIFITASLQERIRRKCIQYNEKSREEEIRKNIVVRDELQEKSGFYKIYPKTIQVDVTNCENAQESTKEVLKHIKL